MPDHASAANLKSQDAHSTFSKISRRRRPKDGGGKAPILSDGLPGNRFGGVLSGDRFMKPL
jgi:hypothetical protein